MTVEELPVRLRGVAVGTLLRLDGDRIMLVFDRAYTEMRDRPTLSLSLLDPSGEIQEPQRATTRRAPPYFANLLPEGRLRSYLATRAGVNQTRDYPLLRLTGGDLPGAVELVAEPSRSTDLGSEPTDDPAASEASRDASVLRFSLAGVQLKFSAIMQALGGLTVPAHGLGGDWIVKLPSTHYEGLPENEFSAMSVASMVGIETPEIRLVPMTSIQGVPEDVLETPMAKANALAIKRFDREAGKRIHTEDFAQVFSLYPERKYERYGYADIARVLATFSNGEAIDQFARRLIYSALIGNADMHLKNWSLIYPDGRTPEIAPAYDMLSTVAHMRDDKMALRLAGAKRWVELTMDNFAKLGERAGVGGEAIVRPVVETIDRFGEVWASEAGHLPIRQRVADAIDRQMAAVPAVQEA